MAPGMGGPLEGLYNLASRIRVSSPIYAFQARGSDGLAEPHERIEEMAQFHLSDLRQLQPRGPYFLIGYSLGGLIMLEIARRLMQAGERIALLAMLDTYPHRRLLRFGPRLRVSTRLALQRIRGMLRPNSPPPNLAVNSVDRVQYHEPNVKARQRVNDAQKRALLDYRPRFYDGEVRYVRAAIPSFFPADPVPVWSHLVRTLHVETVPGRHLEMLTTHVDIVAGIVTRYILEAQSSLHGEA
jgi:thioesterase domain-containing protein